MPTTLYITEPGTTAHKVDERLVLKRENRAISDIPMLNLRQVVVVGRGIDITTEAMLALVARKIDVCFFTRHMKLRARVGGDVSLFGQLRFLQARFVDNPARQLAVARSVVAGKLANQRNLLLRLAAEQVAAEQRSLNQFAVQINQLIERLPRAKDLDSLRGYEGQGATLYFDGLRLIIRDVRRWGFTRREYYPAPDPLNALLSFGYSLLTRDTLAAVYLAGFDPYLGFFHVIDYGRPSLALDLMEEFRPLAVDTLVIQLVNQNLITPADFEQGADTTNIEERLKESGKRSGPGLLFRLKAGARNRYLELYEKRMSEKIPYGPAGERQLLRNALKMQVEQLARHIRGEASEYQPLVLH